MGIFCMQKLSVLLMGSMEVFPLVEDYKKFLPQLKHLQELDVSCSQDSFDDSCMNTLGIYCRDLRYGICVDSGKLYF